MKTLLLEDISVNQLSLPCHLPKVVVGFRLARLIDQLEAPNFARLGSAASAKHAGKWAPIHPRHHPARVTSLSHGIFWIACLS